MRGLKKITLEGEIYINIYTSGLLDPNGHMGQFGPRIHTSPARLALRAFKNCHWGSQLSWVVRVK